MSIDVIKSTISAGGGYAKPNRFLVELPALAGLNTRQINTLCKTTALPGKQILTHDRRIGMKFEKVAYGYAVDDISLSFLLLNDYKVKEYFDEWRSLIVDEEGLSVKYKVDYQKPVKIHQLKIYQDSPFNINAIAPVVNIIPTIASFAGASGALSSLPLGFDFLDFIPEPETKYKSVYAVELEDAFPTQMTATELSDEAEGFLQVNVSLSYTNWKKVESSQQVYELV